MDRDASLNAGVPTFSGLFGRAMGRTVAQGVTVTLPFMFCG